MRMLPSRLLCRSELRQYGLVLRVFAIQEFSRGLRVHVTVVPEVVLEVLLPFVGLHQRREHAVPVRDLLRRHAAWAHEAAPARRHRIDALLFPRRHAGEDTAQSLWRRYGERAQLA